MDTEYTAPPLAGLYKGFVRDNDDPEKRGRIRCYCPQVMGDQDTADMWLGWAEPCIPWIGGLNTMDSGPPYTKTQNGGEEVGVWLMFEMGHPDFPVWMGTFTVAPTIDGVHSQQDLSVAATAPGGSILGDPPDGSTATALAPLQPDVGAKEHRILAKKGRDIFLGSVQGGGILLGPSGAHLVGPQVTINGRLINAAKADKVTGLRVARDVCIMPCPEIEALPSIHLPFMTSGMTGQANLSLEGGCDGCEILGNLMVQLNPFLGAFGLPICILGCVASLIKAVKAVPGSLGVPPNPVELIKAIADLATNCQCLLDLALPFPTGAMCDFAKMVKDIVGLIISVLGCIIGLLQHLVSIHVQAAILMADDNVEVQKAGSCLLAQLGIQTSNLMTKFDAIKLLFSLLAPIFNLMGVVPGIDTIVNGVNNAITAFNNAVTHSTPAGEILGPMEDLKSALQIIYAALVDIVSLCP